MSNSYPIAPGVEIGEQSCRLWFCVERSDGEEYLCSEEFNEETLRKAIVAQIKVLSYYSDDSDEVLQRFNVNYQDAR